MDSMDNVRSGKYETGIEIIDGMGWVEKVGPAGYRRSSQIQYHYKMELIKNQLQSDLIQEMEIDEAKGEAIFDFCWENGHRLGISEVISWFRELVQIIC